jgi:hypothetical protein
MSHSGVSPHSLVLGLLVLPGATQRGLHQKAWIVAEPHFNANWPKVAPFITPAATIAQNELRNLLALDLGKFSSSYLYPSPPLGSHRSSSDRCSSLAAPIPTTSAPATTEKSTTTSSSSSESSPSTTPASVSTSTQTGSSEPENSEDEKDWVMPAKTE